MTTLTITINDIRACGHCVRGTRKFFESYNLDFRDFLTNGIDAETFLATGDAIAKDIVDRTRIRRHG